MRSVEHANVMKFEYFAGIPLRVLVLIYLTLIASGTCQHATEDDYPDIEDLFPTLPEYNDTIHSMQYQTDTRFVIDLEKLDINKFLKKLDILHSILSAKEQAVETRRKTMIPLMGGDLLFNEGRTMLTHTKACDTMLTIIYMARHKIRSLENDPNFNPRDTGYRIAFLYRRIKRLHKRMMDVYTTHLLKPLPKHHTDDEKQPILWHQKAIKIYTDFMYLFWVLVKLDEVYQEKNRAVVKKKFGKPPRKG